MPGIGNLNPALNSNRTATENSGTRGRGGYSAITAEAGYNVPKTTPKAPSKANDAPKPSVTTIGTGLIAALNADQLRRLNTKQIEIADIYEIKFGDNIIASAGMVPAGDLDKTLAGANNNVLSAAQQLLPDKQSLNTTVRTRGVRAGQQIIQFIDQVIRTSNYIVDQSRVVWNTKTKKWETNGVPAQQFAWYKVICDLKEIDYDYKRNDHAYHITFTVVPYETPMLSTYFASGRFRGVHKTYNYWFTGQNTQILQYDQTLNKQWTQAITNDVPSATSKSQAFNGGELWKTQIFAASGQSSQGAEQKVYEAGANAADFLYEADLQQVKLLIIGDPAWMPSPLASTQLQNFVSTPFFPDGSINFDASGAYFTVGFNRPVDYDLQKGLMDAGQTNYFADRTNGIAGIARDTTTYTAIGVKHMFKGGKFTQELSGKIAMYDYGTNNSDAGRPPPPQKDNQSRTPDQSNAETQRLLNAANKFKPVTRPDGITNLARVTTQAANNELAQGRIGVDQAQAILVNGSQRDIDAFGGRVYLQSIIDGANAPVGSPKAPQQIVKDGNPG